LLLAIAPGLFGVLKNSSMAHRTATVSRIILTAKSGSVLTYLAVSPLSNHTMTTRMGPSALLVVAKKFSSAEERRRLDGHS
jgi:hypothetical protein